MLKIGDFGFSKIFDEVKSGYSLSGIVVYFRVGIRCWKVLEFFKKKIEKYSKVLDIFSCGLLFYYILVNKKYFFGDSEFMELVDF